MDTPLGPIERACLRSALRQDHRVRLFTYGRLEGVPDGVEVADAADILPADRIIRYKNGSVSLFSNRFRYALQRASLGLWADADHYFLKPHDLAEPYVFGRQADGQVNGAVLKIPADAPVLDQLLALFESGEAPPWINERERELLLSSPGGKFAPEKAQWGLTGPRGLTFLVPSHGLEMWVKPQEVFYPMDFREADWILDPGKSVADVATAQTLGIHLWNEKIKGFKNQPAPEGSFLARLQDEGR